MHPLRLTLLITIQLFIFSLFLSPQEAAFSQTLSAPDNNQLLKTFLDKVYGTMDEHYYLPVSPAVYNNFLREYPAKKLLELNERSKKTPSFLHLGAGLLVNQLKNPSDTFTNFVPPEKSKEFKEKAYAATIDLGIEGKKSAQGFEITRVQKHAEAFEKGVRQGDTLLFIAGVSVLPMTADEIAQKLTPESGKITQLSIKRFKDKKIYEINLLSKSYFKETVEKLPSPKKEILIIKISHFNQMTGPDFEEELSLSQLKKTKKVILDLRDNGGGPPLAAREILGFFTNPNDFLFAISRKKQKPVMLASPAKSAAYRGALDILVNEKTGSAAEMFSGVLQSKNLAKLIGQKTAGATYLKSIYDFEDKSMIFMITSLTFFPDKRVFPKDGLTPDFNLSKDQDALEFAIQNT